MRVLLGYFNPAADLLPAPPIGLSYVATATHQAGHEVHFLDLSGCPTPLAAVREAVRAFAPQVVGISARNIDNVVYQRQEWHLAALTRVVDAVRRERPAIIVVGGPAISILGAAALTRLDVDFAVLGEGEETFPRLLAAIATTQEYHDIPGLCYRAGASVVCTPSSLLPRFGPSGMETWIDWPGYEQRGGTWAIQSKRGCPLHCTYCAYPAIEGRACRRRSAEDVVDEIERVRAQVAPRTFEFVDSTFNVPAEHAERICREIIRRKLGLNLTAMGVNPLGASENLFALMREAGFNSMMITPESASDVMLTSLRKGFTVDDVHRTARLARASGIASAWFFMLGGPGETRETVEQTVSFVERHLDWKGCLSIFMTGIRVLPGTELARRLASSGYPGPGRDLAEPSFYLSPAVEHEWIIARINDAIGRCPGIVHGAEEGQSRYERLFDRVLQMLGAAPPYWRFLPILLRLPPVPFLRRRYPPFAGDHALAVSEGATPGLARDRIPSS